MIVSKEEAWKRLPNEVSIPINKKDFAFEFTRYWFRNRNQCTFSTFLKPKFGYLDRPITMIQIGIFEGMDLVWSFQNLIRHPDSRVIAIDPWEATTKLKADTMDAVQKRARHNLRKYRDNLEIIRGKSQDVLPTLKHLTGKVDLIIIDGDHTAPAVVQDAELSLKLVKVGGWLLFDDVRNDIPKRDHVAQGLEQFLPAHEGELKHVWSHRYCDCYERVA